MEIKDSVNINGLGLFSTTKYKKDDIIFVLTGEIVNVPCRESIHIGNNKHIIDEFGIYINHSFNPSVYIDGTNVVACHDINCGEELTFNYNESEINMAAPFFVGDLLVGGTK